MVRFMGEIGRRRSAGLTITMIGQCLVVISLVGVLSAADEASTSTSASTPSTSASTQATTTAPATSTTAATTTAAPVTTTTTTLATTTTTTTTTRVVEVETLDDFVAAFNEANSAGDTSFALARLHPVVIESFSHEQCQQWLEERFVFTTIEIDGVATPPAASLISPPAGEVEVDAYFTVAPSLTFRGSVTEATAGFGYVDGQVHWFTNCEAQ